VEQQKMDALDNVGENSGTPVNEPASETTPVKKTLLIKGLIFPRARGAYVADSFGSVPLYQKIILGVFIISTFLMILPVFGFLPALISAPALVALLFVFAFVNCKFAHFMGSKEKSLREHWIAGVDLFVLSLLATAAILFIYVPLAFVFVGHFANFGAGFSGQGLGPNALLSVIGTASPVIIVALMVPFLYVSYLSIAYISGFVGRGYGYSFLAFILVTIAVTLANTLLQMLTMATI